MATLAGAIAFCYVNRASGKTITATTAATGYPASNLNNARMSSSWRSTALTGQRIVADLTTAQDIDVVALIGYNGEDDSTCTVKTSEASDLSAHEYTSGSITPLDATTYPVLSGASDTPRYGRNLIHFTGATKNSRYVGFDTLDDSGNADGFLRGRVLWAGPAWQPSDSFDLTGEKFRRRRELVGPPGMQRYVTYIDVEFFAMSEGEARKLEGIAGARLSTGRLLVVPRPLSVSTFLYEALYCTLEGLPDFGAVPVQGGLCWRVGLTLKEVED